MTARLRFSSLTWLNPRHWTVGAKLVLMIAPLLLAATLAVTWVFPGRQRVQIVEEQVTASAEAVLMQLRADREYYSAVIVPRLLTMKATVQADYHQLPTAFPLPATFLREVTEMINHHPNAYQVRLVSPWPINKQNAIQDAFQEEGFRTLTTLPGLYSRRDTLNGLRVMRFLAPDRAVSQVCVDCHNTHPHSPKHDFRLNDLMGAIEIRVPIEASLQASRRAQVWMLWGGFGLSLIVMAIITLTTKQVVSRPLRDLTTQMQKIELAEGEMKSTPVVPAGGRAMMGEEVQQLSDQFWRMYFALETHQQERASELQRQAESQQVLNRRLLEMHQVAQVLQQAISEEEVYRILTHTFREALGLRQILILRLNASEDRLEIVWAEPKRSDLGIDSYPVWDAPSRCPVIRSGREYVVQDTRKDLTCLTSISNKEDGAYWCVPLVIGARTIGVVHLVSATPQSWTDETRKWTEALINLAAPMVGHLRHLERARRRALIDELTSTYNRRFLEEVLAKMILPGERRKGQIISVLMIDLDHFKNVNDTYGHQVGDLVLKTVASAMHRALKESDVLARYGGEEFMAVLPRTDAGGAVVVAERLRVAVAEVSLRRLAPAAPDHVTISIGVATYPIHAKTVAELIRVADEALYQAKSFGRNRVVCPPVRSTVIADLMGEKDERT
ncbi:MAG TPA: diguanylate cyclase [Nitrospiraceae bacterium]|nr:diguanylate cyclase [Nitrospiraceae bacterium]